VTASDNSVQAFTFPEVSKSKKKQRNKQTKKHVINITVNITVCGFLCVFKNRGLLMEFSPDLQHLSITYVSTNQEQF